MTEKILYIQTGSFSNVNNSVLEILKREFPNYEIEQYDTWDLIKNKTSYGIYAINFLYFLKEYGLSFLRGKKYRKDFVAWFFATSYISAYITKELRKFAAGKKYAFSFQTQSLFNGKIENTPYFIYTDHSTLTNHLYPDIDPQNYIRSQAWINKEERGMFHDASMIFTFGSHVRKCLIDDYHIAPEKVVTAFTGSNVTGKHHYDPNRPFSKNILFVGGDWERKGGPLLIEAFEEVVKIHPDASVTIIGSFQETTVPNVKFLGKLPVNQLNTHYENAEIFCMPTVREPFGVAFVEAMKYSLPIVSNNIGGLPDLVTNGVNGFLLPNKKDAYVKALCDLLENPEKCRAMGRKGAEMASEFTWVNVGKTLHRYMEPFLKA